MYIIGTAGISKVPQIRAFKPNNRGLDSWSTEKNHKFLVYWMQNKRYLPFVWSERNPVIIPPAIAP